MPQDSDKRKYIRTDRPFSLKMRIKPDEGQKATFTDWDIVMATNLSAGGVLIYYNEELKIGSFVDLRLYISMPLFTINCVGKVISIKKQPKSPIFAVAISFTEIDEQDIELINEAVEESLR